MNRSQPLLTVEDLSVTYAHGAVEAVRGVSFEIERGETVALVGESGSGKSTTAHAVLGLLPRGSRVSGRIGFQGDDLLALRARQWRAVRGDRIGFVPQDPTVSLNPTRRVGRQIADAIRIHRGHLPKAVIDARVVELLDLVGIRDPRQRAERYPHELSGGMRQRVLIAAALANEPDLLVADEPTSALDVTVQQQILDHIDLLRAELGIAVLLITHDLGVARDRSDHVVVLSQGRAVERGRTLVVTAAPRAEYTTRLLAAVPTIDRGRLIWDAASSTVRPRGAGAAPGVGGTPPVLAATGLRKTFAAGRHGLTVAVDDVDVELRRGQTLGVVGESGSGKSTLARLLTHLTPADAGTITVDGRDATHLHGEELRILRRRMQFVYQNPRASLDPRFTVGRTLAEPLRAAGHERRADHSARVGELLEMVGLPTEFAERRPAELSGGQLQRVAIARALANSPDIVVLDEPVSALDVSVQAQILGLLVRLQAELGVSMVFISHDLAVICQVSDHVLVMHDGRVVESGPADRIFADPGSSHSRALLDAIPGRRASAELALSGRAS